MRIYSKNIPAKFHPDSIWNDGTLDFLDPVEERSSQQEQDE